ncbi:hypothetical protein EHF33_18725 (plasmid) [Deinococcus psychrotolerans]|uniref:Uncharacterized protein n=1 Tax=Deinococcus psychrotolerans TaxID=2489213 RepID=A0A3G8YTB7_9DEIO|nr:hypothetical protein [Deinococcus psychrotolerans]AZI44941.1 hypothetical protein EHF33_18725 [Deinococcus psychrotolerans]
MALFPSLMILRLMTLTALFGSVRDSGVWLFTLFISVALLDAAAVRKVLAFRATTRRAKSIRVTVLRVQKRGW